MAKRPELGMYFSTFHHGQTLLSACKTDYPNPVSFVWGMGMAAGQGKRSRFEIFGCFTMPRYRGQGIMSELFRELLKHYDVLMTQDGSDTGGEALLKSFGFTLDPVTGVWFYTKKVKHVKSKTTPVSV